MQASRAFSGRYYGRPDVRALDGNVDRAKWNNYCKKDGDFVDHGEIRLPGPARKDKFDEGSLFKEFCNLRRLQVKEQRWRMRGRTCQRNIAHATAK